MNGILLRVLAAGLIMGDADYAAAQYVLTTHLEAGFGVQTLTGSTNGEVDAAIYGETPTGRCGGFLGTTPDHRLQFTEAMPELRLELETYGMGGSLVVHGPDGVRCSGPPTTNNAVLEGPWEAGDYSIYAGTFTQYYFLTYDLIVRESPSAVDEWGDLGGTLDEGLGAAIFAPQSEIWGMGELGLADLEIVDAEPGTEAGTAEASAEGALAPASERLPSAGTLHFDPDTQPSMSERAPVQGEIEALALSPPDTDGCVGWVDIDPVYSIVTGRVTDVQVVLDAPLGAALVGYGPLEELPTWRCTAISTVPALLFPAHSGGTYLIWVASPGAEGGEYVLSVATP